MAYSTHTELSNLTGTSLSQTILEQIISLADYEIDSILRANGISGGNANDLKAASLKLAIAGVITRHRMDGTMPSSLSIGGISVGDNLDAAIEKLREDAYKIIHEIIRKERTYRQTFWTVNRC